MMYVGFTTPAYFDAWSSEGNRKRLMTANDWKEALDDSNIIDKASNMFANAKDDKNSNIIKYIKSLEKIKKDLEYSGEAIIDSFYKCSVDEFKDLQKSLIDITGKIEAVSDSINKLKNQVT